ncbi:hypothetical protein [Aquisphaera insulae]|uniref:hypothetical protein n=1 Tax=Aquisphaera insulae TaxID=2712864 RepID=UPI0013EC41FB|nr:hypothetical protein [Aquisphaera insulae]
MLASSTRNRLRRRGVILILVLGLLGLMALIGVTFATFSGQARQSARSFVQSKLQPPSDELMDYALAQLISDTADVRSAIRGHSMARDMYGNDANRNGYVDAHPTNGTFLTVTASSTTGADTYLTTNIQLGDPAFYGYDFTRWTMRAHVPGAVDSSLEILDVTSPSGYLVFHVKITATESGTSLYNPNLGTTVPAAAYYLLQANFNLGGSNPVPPYQIVLDGRWMHAFNGPGIGALSSRGNFRFNGQSPATQGMDEDYDAADLENWFLAMQSADGQVIIPSFHRPAAIRIDPGATVPVYDWGGTANATYESNAVGNWANSASRILRPRAADGHDSATFPDLVPDATTKKLNFDVDNDGDGTTDSVWVDLGYPPRRNAQGHLFKPLFAFMVIGLNGRIPLNSAGNLAGSINPGIPFPTVSPTYHYGNGAYHASHLGNSVSEIDPSYALQNAFDPNYDVAAAFNYPLGVSTDTMVNTQVDNAGVDVRISQLRNLLAGTRPPTTSTFGTMTDADKNYVFSQQNSGSATQNPLAMPNGVADPNDTAYGVDPDNAPVVLRLTPSVPGRWGESGSVPGGIQAPSAPSPPAIGGYLNPVRATYLNPVRAGYSYDSTDVLTGTARDAADDNYNGFDPAPLGHGGEVADSDAYDPAGALLLPVDRMRRFVTPADINGTGSVTPWTTTYQAGADALGRVRFSSYYRPPGTPGSVTPYSASTPPTTGEVYYPVSGTTGNYFYTNGPTNNPNSLPFPTYLPDVTNNPLHAFEFFRLPPVIAGGGPGHTPSGTWTFQFQRSGGMPVNRTLDTAGHLFPIQYPTYDATAMASKSSDGLNDADEMNLYNPNAQADQAFGYGDLEWLYRQQDVDGSSLSSRLPQLAPISFANAVDAQRRRRLFSTDVWESNVFSWAPDNPNSAFPNNRQFSSPTADASLRNLSLPTPSLAHRDRKINLNMPLPVSNDPDEPVRRKWISDAYQLLKSVLPPKATDTPEEKAQLSQFLVNVIDFRDPDGTMTHFQNPDVMMVLGDASTTPMKPSYLVPAGATVAAGSPVIPLHQFGMEYNPVAINEAMASSYLMNGTGAANRSNRFIVELVNTLSQSAISFLPANSFNPTIANPPDVSQLDLSVANYDMVIAGDDPVSRPDPYVGQLQPIVTARYYGQMPFNQATGATPLFSPALTTGTVQLPPLYSYGAPVAAAGSPFSAADFPTNYFYTIGSAPPSVAATPVIPLVGTLNSAFDPFSSTAPPATVPTTVIPPAWTNGMTDTKGTAVGIPTKAYPAKITAAPPTGGAQYYWACLRRPANLFAPPQPNPAIAGYNPMVVVDAMRFAFSEGGGTIASGSPPTINLGTQRICSSQRCQPFRGGHAVRLPSDTTTGVAPLYTPYGYSEQMAAPTSASTVGNYNDGTTNGAITRQMYHTFGLMNDQSELWDYFPFNDRDFTSVAELLLVPGCPPGLFTKQFVELAPMPPTTGAVASVPITFPVPSTMPPNPPTAATTPSAAPTSPNAALRAPVPTAGTVSQPRTFPYLVDKFFYTGYGNTTAPVPAIGNDPGGKVGGHAADGWFKMMEFFEVPSQAIGAIGTVAAGTNFDWARQDARAGQVNLNLIIDEEVFFAVFGSQSVNITNGAALSNTDSFTQTLLSFAQVSGGPGVTPEIVTSSKSGGAPSTSYSMWGASSHPGIVANDPVGHGGGAYNGMKAAFAQFLYLRHGGDRFLFGANNTERPFHSLSYPDIDYTIMRPANLPPTATSTPALGYTAPTGTPAGYYFSNTTAGYVGDPGLRNPYLNPWGPVSSVATAGVYGPTNTYQPGINIYNSTPATSVTMTMPPPIPPRRLFQPPDAYGSNAFGTPPTLPPTAPQSNASDSGDPFVNRALTAANGALPVLTGGLYANSGYPNIFWSGNAPAPGIPATGVYLGSNVTPKPDLSQSPYWRTEMLQKVMNLTTVRTHQYAVWITIGFFEVKREGDLGMLATAPVLAFDLMGPEIGAAVGQATRYRAFFIVNRLKLTGFDPNTPGSFRPAVVYRQRIE